MAQQGANSSVENLVVEAGFFDVTSGSSGTAIGAGAAMYSDSHSYVSNLVIQSGVFHLTSGEAASGLGSSEGYYQASSFVRSLVIDTGSFNVSSPFGGAGIGSGYADDDGKSYVQSLTIHDGQFNVSGGQWAAGIGSARASLNSASSVGRITIESGWFNVTGGPSGPGIGSSDADLDSTSSVGVIGILGGSFNISGGDSAAAIGSAMTNPGLVPEIRIRGGSFILEGSVGIGSDISSRNSIVLEGESMIECRSLAFSSCVRGGDVTLNTGSLRFQIWTPKLLDYESLSRAVSCNLDVEYMVESEGEGLSEGGPYLHLQDLHNLGDSSPMMLRIMTGEKANPTLSREVVFDSSRVLALLVSLPSDDCLFVISGRFLCQSDGSSIVLGNGETVVTLPSFCEGEIAPVPGSTPTPEFTFDRFRLKVRVIRIPFLMYTLFHIQ
jgi:hypothetical protein